ncbi:MAG: hypothetical protein A4S09_04535 [Proteobacteria bacterium SG_bin7]|nr:MAG: hypothetical protein A4S09_04535 [Proteobacteria bacterium SG_bin7]
MGDILVLQKLLNFESDLELDNCREVVLKTMKLFQNEFEAQEVYWFLGERLEVMIRTQFEQGSIQIPRARLGEACPQYLTTGSKSQGELNSLIAGLAKGLIQFDLNDFVHIKTTDSEFLIWPIYGHVNQEKIGDILIEKPRKDWKTTWVFESIVYVRQVVARNLTEALRFVRARELAYVDDLTGLFNQRYLAMALDRQISLSRRQKNCFSVLFLDIDHFKEVNDQHGHIIGSKILSQLGQMLKTNIRGNDVGIRYGGDEYLLMLVGANAVNANVAAERIRALISRKDFIVDGRTYKITTSIGVAAFPEHAESRDSLISLADQAMYQSKNSGRNCIYIAS